MNTEAINWLNHFLTLLTNLIGILSLVWWLRGKIDTLHQNSKDIVKLETNLKTLEEKFNIFNNEFSVLKGGTVEVDEAYIGNELSS